MRSGLFYFSAAYTQQKALAERAGGVISVESDYEIAPCFVHCVLVNLTATSQTPIPFLVDLGDLDDSPSQ